jgi:hypothetical protein
MPAISVNICDNFSAAPGTLINWTNIPPGGCTISPDGSNPWPFSVPPPIILPAPAGVGIKVGLPPGTYCFIVSCCKNARVCVTVT